MLDPNTIASRIDHTILKAEATVAQVDEKVAEAITHKFASVCVNPIFVPHVHARLRGSGVKTCCVVGFPLGANFAAIKAGEAAMAVSRGAEEIDMVSHLPYLLAGDLDSARAEIMEVVYAARQVRKEVIVKVIVESAALAEGVSAEVYEQRIATACRAVREAGADFIKTSTGFHPAGGATVATIQLMRKHGTGLRIKASGGIKTAADAHAMFEAGAHRLGCSAGVTIIAGGTSKANY